MHLHGNKMAILYSGKWDEGELCIPLHYENLLMHTRRSTDRFNIEYDETKFNPDPVYRDTVTVNTDSYVVVQVAATNPGVWRWHCHVNIHHRGGMAMVLDVGGDSAVEAVRATPDDVNLCPIRSGQVGGSSAAYKFCFTWTVILASFLSMYYTMWF